MAQKRPNVVGTEDRFAKTGSGQTQAQRNVNPRYIALLCFAAQGIELMVTFWPFIGKQTCPQSLCAIL
eukprot:COSAG06_NODE_4820_length_3930_cov_4.506134_1_plen_68_part_00